MHDLAMAKSPGRRLQQAQRVPSGQLRDSGVPSTTGVYCWWDGDEPLFVAATDDLHHQLVEVETGRPQRRVPEFRQFARVRAQELGRLGYGENRAAIRAAVNDCIAEWAVSWIRTRSITRAELLAEEARADLLGEGEPWEARPGEDRWLRRYLDDLRVMGRVYVEVPVGQAAGGTTRRIDAVRFPHLDSDLRKYTPVPFQGDLDAAGEIELIEVKRRLNRPVIGQLLVARYLAAKEWKLPASFQLSLVALVTVTDLALEGFCAYNGIRVETVHREEGDMDIEAF
jgi:hypothetical protein